MYSKIFHKFFFNTYCLDVFGLYFDHEDLYAFFLAILIDYYIFHYIVQLVPKQKRKIPLNSNNLMTFGKLCYI